jgi:hypothetical protein
MCVQLGEGEQPVSAQGSGEFSALTTGHSDPVPVSRAVERDQVADKCEVVRGTASPDSEGFALAVTQAAELILRERHCGISEFEGRMAGARRGRRNVARQLMDVNH